MKGLRKNCTAQHQKFDGFGLGGVYGKFAGRSLTMSAQKKVASPIFIPQEGQEKFVLRHRVMLPNPSVSSVYMYDEKSVLCLSGASHRNRGGGGADLSPFARIRSSRDVDRCRRLKRDVELCLCSEQR